jgi:hypothetical protein
VRGLLLGADGAHFVFGRDEGTVRLYWTGVP